MKSAPRGAPNPCFTQLGFYLGETELGDVEDVARWGGTHKVQRRLADPIRRGRPEIDLNRDGRDGEAMEAAGAAGSRTAIRRSGTEAVLADVRQRRREEQERHRDGEKAEAKQGPAGHLAILSQYFEDDRRSLPRVWLPAGDRVRCGMAAQLILAKGLAAADPVAWPFDTRS